MGKIDIRYCFTLNGDHSEIIDLSIDDNTLENTKQPSEDLPEWANLGFCQCSHCPLDPETHPYCPVATSLTGVADRFEEIVSHDEVGVTVISKERTTSQQTTAQRAISSLLGLLFATSGCPHTQFFKPMACFHLPLATERETIFRVAGTYLMGQYFRWVEGKDEDLEFLGLAKIYDNVHEVNMGISERLRSALESDSSVNAIIFLDMFTKALPFVIEDKLLDIRYLFNSFFSDEFEEIIRSLSRDMN